MYFRLLVCLSIIISSGLILSSIFFTQKADAETVTTSITVIICGNSIIESGEQCDDGNAIGGDGCSASCQNEGPLCGNGSIEVGEQCDDGNGLSGDGCSASCQNETPQFGGGTPVIPPPVSPTRVILKGKAYPYAEVTVLRDGVVVESIQAKPNADFVAEFNGLNSGSYTFGIYAQDIHGLRSITFTFNTTISTGTVTTIGGILLPPTITIDKFFAKQGETFIISGSSSPNALVELTISKPDGISPGQTYANSLGEWSYSLITRLSFVPGKYSVKAKATSTEKLLSIYSNSIEFLIQEKKDKDEPDELEPFLPTPKGPCRNGDLNGDGRINLVDFSILLYWWGTHNSCADLSDDGNVDIVDLSILLYWWTG